MNKDVLIDNLNINYQDIGKGDIVFFIHGFGEDASIWNNQIEYLQTTHRLIVPNIPGTNSSSLIDKENVIIDDYAIILHELYKQIISYKYEKITMLGHSMGGYIALAFAEKYGEVLNGFGLIHSTAFADSEDKKLMRKKAIDVIDKYGAEPFLKNTIPNLFSSSSIVIFKDKIEELIKSSKQFNKKTLQQYYSAIMQRPDRTDVLRKSKLPVLFIIGEEDNATPLKDLLKQIHLPKIAQILFLKNVAHMGMIEAKDEVNNTISKFLNIEY